jgi:hypothetical protein
MKMAKQQSARQKWISSFVMEDLFGDFSTLGHYQCKHIDENQD